MTFQELPLNGAKLISPEMHSDNRGQFGRLFCQNELQSVDVAFNLMQVNHSVTNKKGTIRGMHFQFPPKQEKKIVKCIKGKIFDVIIDIRSNSDTFLDWYGVILSEDNLNALYIPEGFAHGFQTLKDDCELIYFHSEIYSPGLEGAIRFDEPKVDILWPLNCSEMSARDKEHPYLTNAFKGI